MESIFDLVRVRRNSSRGRDRGSAHEGHGGKRSYGGRVVVGPGIRRVPQGSLGVNHGPSAFGIAKSFHRTKNIPWQPDLFEDSLAASELTRHENGTKLHVTNLAHSVSNADIRDLFSEIGELQRYAIHYDKNGEPTGSAEVLYTKRSDAFAAMKFFHNVKLDGKLMKIEIMSPNSGVPVSARISVIGGVNRAPARRVLTAQGAARPMPMAPNWGFIQRPRGGMRNSMGHGWSQVQGQGQGLRRGRGRRQPKLKSAVELDKELEKYHAEAMETSS